ELICKTRRKRRRDLGSPPSHDDRWVRRLDGLWKCWTIEESIVVPHIRISLILGRLPHARKNLKLFRVSSKSLRATRKGNPIGFMFQPVPTGPKTEVNSPSRHMIHLGD